MGSRNRHWVVCGGIGSGKSTVRRLLESDGFVTIDADSIGHEVLRSDGPAFAQVAATWPDVVRDGEIDRSALATIVFSEPGELASLESITHPYIFDRIRSQVQEIPAPVAVEVPLLSHQLGDDWLRIVVDAHDDVRLRRTIARGISPDDARARMATQPSRREWLAVADIVVPNHGSLEALESTVVRLTSVG